MSKIVIDLPDADDTVERRRATMYKLAPTMLSILADFRHHLDLTASEKCSLISRARAVLGEIDAA